MREFFHAKVKGNNKFVQNINSSNLMDIEDSNQKQPIKMKFFLMQITNYCLSVNFST